MVQQQKHQILSRSSSEPSQPTHTPELIRTADRRHTVENTLDQDETNTDHLADDCTDPHAHDDAQTDEVTHTQQKHIGRDSVIKDNAGVTEEQAHVENETNNQRLDDEARDKRKDTNMELLEREEGKTDTLRWSRMQVHPLKYCTVYFTVVPSFAKGNPLSIQFHMRNLQRLHDKVVCVNAVGSSSDK